MISRPPAKPQHGAVTPNRKARFHRSERVTDRHYPGRRTGTGLRVEEGSANSSAHGKLGGEFRALLQRLPMPRDAAANLSMPASRTISAFASALPRCG